MIYHFAYIVGFKPSCFERDGFLHYYCIVIVIVNDSTFWYTLGRPQERETITCCISYDNISCIEWKITATAFTFSEKSGKIEI